MKKSAVERLIVKLAKDPDHDGDDDSTAKGDTDHDYFPVDSAADAALETIGAALSQALMAVDQLRAALQQDDDDIPGQVDQA